MGCESCSNNKSGLPSGCRNNGSCGNGGCNKMFVFNWLTNMDTLGGNKPFDCVEVRFKNGRKEFFKNAEELPIYEGDAVVVEADPGYDVGMVSIVGELVRLQMQKKGVFPKSTDLKKLVRKTTEKDLEKWKEGKSKEENAMREARMAAYDLNLAMKISDVEYQGDLSKAVFYYTAEGRVDFRELVKILAEKFRLRIEMKQIGMRQEAGRLGGIGSCGRELCCSTWLTDFRSVSTSAARYQQLSLNPAKLAGQCGKLKCCLNYELDVYLDELKAFPDTKKNLKTKKGEAFCQKIDIFGHTLWYSYQDEPGRFIELPLDRVKEIMQMNKEKNFPDDLLDMTKIVVEKKPDYANVVGQDDLNRFDGLHSKTDSKRKRKKKRKPSPQSKKEDNGKSNSK